MPVGLPRPENFTKLRNSASDIQTTHTEDMQCSVILERDRNSGNVKMKTINNYKNPYKKEANFNIIVDQLCTRLQDIKDQKSASQVGMPTCSLEHTEAVRRYYAAFPALKKGQESPLQYYLPPPAWCRKSSPDCKQAKMQSEIALSRDWNAKNKKLFSGKERRNSYHGQRKGKKRCNSYSRSFESKESLPEWVTHEGVWDMETQDPVKEFIRAIALDEGYGTCENTVTDEIKEITSAKLKMNESMVPNWDDSIDFDADWIVTEDLNPRVRTPMEEELYAKFEAKFDRSIEALWTKDATPDDEYQDLPIDFQDLLSSPSDHLFADPSAEKCSLISLTESIWSSEAADDESSKMAEALHDRLRPLQLGDGPCHAEPGSCHAEPGPCPPQLLDSLAFDDGEELYSALACVAKTMRSFTAINHSRDNSGFVEVPPRRRPLPPSQPAPPPAPPPPAPREDLLTSARTHFKPIRADADAARYADGDSFDISGDLDPVEFSRSESGGVYLKSSLERYLEYRTGGIDYGRLNLTAAQRCPDLDDPGFRLRFPMRQLDAAVQTDGIPDAWACEECGHGAKKMRANTMDGIWGVGGGCGACGQVAGVGRAGGGGEELAAEWEELVSAISSYAAEAEMRPADRKRRHSAALRCPATTCSHPHARFLPCCTAALDRPLTR